nr:uncharacterized protein LOC109157656 [Ipomoea batatas]
MDVVGSREAEGDVIRLVGGAGRGMLEDLADPDVHAARHELVGRVDLGVAHQGSNVSKAPFLELGISQSLEDGIYLAAFLACWLCVFVLLGTPTRTIRLETFKMACTMTKGNKAVKGIIMRCMPVRGSSRVSASWLCISRKNDKDFIFCDNNRGSEEDFEYFKGLCLYFLILRQGPQCKAESYMPHCFRRQFRFYQAYAPDLLEADNCDV